MKKTTGLSEAEAYEVVKNLEGSLSKFNPAKNKFEYKNPNSAEALNNPSAIIEVFADETRAGNKLNRAQILYAIKSGFLYAFGFHKDHQQKYQKISCKVIKSSLLLAKKNRNHILGHFSGIWYQISPKFLGRSKRKQANLEILEIYAEYIEPSLDNFPSISAAIREIQRVAEIRYGALYHCREKRHHGKKGFNTKNISRKIADKFLVQKSL